MRKSKHNPPRPAQKLLTLFLRRDLAEEVTGDLEERFDKMMLKTSLLRARFDYWRQVLNYIRPFAIRKGRLQKIMHYGMVRSYFKIGWRNIVKYKAFSAINVFGLALAMSVCMLIILMVADQRRYDAFHAKGDRIYRITLSTNYATTPLPLAAAIKNNYTVAEETTVLVPGPAGDAVYQNKLAEMRGYFAEPSFFSIFSFALEKGDVSTALQQPYTAVISQELAFQLYGNDDPIGKTFDFSDRQLAFPQEFDGIGAPPVPWGTFTVTGVVDESKYKSHLAFDVLMSAATQPSLITAKKIEDRTNAWDWFYRPYTFVLLKEDKSLAELQTALDDLSTRTYTDKKNEQTKDLRFIPQKLSDIQLNLRGNDTNNRLPLIGYKFLIILACVIMITACFNYTNLSVARALTRAKEIGVRKVTGAQRGSIVAQFLSESVITSVIALVLAVGFLFLLAPAFKDLWLNKFLKFELPSTPDVYVVFLGFAILIGLIAGIYPAFYLSKYNPVKALKNPGTSQRGKFGLRKTLSVVQFVISLFFITTAILVYRQFSYYMQFDYGFKSENIVNIELQGVDYEKLKHELSSIPEVTNISATDIIPATGTNNGMDIKKPGTQDEYIQTTVLQTDENFLDNLEVKILAGKNLPPREQGANFIVISEKALQKLGFATPHDAVGQTVEARWSNEQLVIAGVFEDFTYRLLINTREVNPITLRNQPTAFQYANVKISSKDPMGAVKKIEAQWKKIDPIHPLKYEFFDQQLASMQQGVFDLVKILGFIAFLAIAISCLGLLGMATYTTERRTKEIGIRKVLGAADFTIARLLSKEFMMMLLLAIFIGVPLSYFINNMWLQKLTTRVEFGITTALAGVFILLALGVITIASQTIRASKANPVNSLKSE
ncbi:MAG TPA: ABC transporter permease [Cyclobacteriaceae bacterium]|nr:ABC transporter permease [Cyclobacteriaceae bacterium]HMV09369.1 ABC transporter permease [Cyclobacteriaceae bacterium]HMV90722.1 ABC transporter permease [Cyclobacteriaceae bacterium]HMX00982.1 ABC transporter permease [Cyclobacteriaceae bacterium]HMX51122.1 ABC transporter permease [Cyclobacteriaceae bacterium]